MDLGWQLALLISVILCSSNEEESGSKSEDEQTDWQVFISLLC